MNFEVAPESESVHKKKWDRASAADKINEEAEKSDTTMTLFINTYLFFFSLQLQYIYKYLFSKQEKLLVKRKNFNKYQVRVSVLSTILNFYLPPGVEDFLVTYF